MLETLEGLEGVAVFMNDILIYGTPMEQHDARLEKVLQRVELAGLKLNKEKCSLRQSQLRFLGHLIDQSEVRPDPDKGSGHQSQSPQLYLQTQVVMDWEVCCSNSTEKSGSQ